MGLGTAVALLAVGVRVAPMTVVGGGGLETQRAGLSPQNNDKEQISETKEIRGRCFEAVISI